MKGQISLAMALNGVLVAGVLQVKPVGAQSASAEEPTGQAGTLEEIVVTAEKRETSLQRTPIAVAAITTDALQRAGVNDLLNVNKLVPDVLITRVAVGAQIDIRGVFSQDLSPTAESPNATAIDGATIVKSTALAGLLFDLQRVEILKGPQGTLYGRNSTGGAVNFITNKPTQTGSVDAEVETGNYSLLRTTAAVNVPITDTLATRVAFQTYSHKGYYQSGLDDADEKAGRFSALWKPTNADSLLFTADLEVIGGVGTGAQQIVGTYNAAQGGSNRSAFYTVPGNPRDDSLVYGDADPYRYKSTNRGLMLQYDRDFGFATWTTQISDRTFDSNPVVVGALNNIPANAYYVAGLPYGGRSYVPVNFHSDTAETRLTSSSTTPLQWVVGLNALYDHDGGENEQFPTQVNQFATLNVQNIRENAKSEAVFGQTTWTPTQFSKLHLTAGARYTGDQKTATTATYLGTGIAPPVLQPGLSGLQNWKASWTGTTTRFAINYDITDTVMVYASRATGYKAGGIAYGPTPLYKPEHNTAYELGLKSRFLDNRLQINLEGFQYHYTDFEYSISYALGNTATRVITVASAGEATMRGYALDLQYLLTDNDRVSLTFAGERAVFGHNVPPIPPYSATGTTPETTNTLPLDYSNTHLPGIPNYGGRFVYDHTFKFGFGAFDPEFATNFRGRELLADTNTNYPNPAFPAVAPAYFFNSHAWAMYDASVRFTPTSSKWNLTAYVHNLTNENQYQSGALNQSAGLLTASLFPPRTVGVVLGAHF